MIKPWLFEFFHQPLDPQLRGDPQAVHEHFRWYTDLWTRADTRNFEGIFFSEHHFGAAYSPSPNLVISHVAARTTRLRLGVLGSVTPYTTPWRIVEEIAMLDHLTDGRLEIGVVSGIPPELAVVGISPQVAAERHAGDHVLALEAGDRLGPLLLDVPPLADTDTRKGPALRAKWSSGPWREL